MTESRKKSERLIKFHWLLILGSDFYGNAVSKKRVAHPPKETKQ